MALINIKIRRIFKTNYQDTLPTKARPQHQDHHGAPQHRPDKGGHKIEGGGVVVIRGRRRCRRRHCCRRRHRRRPGGRRRRRPHRDRPRGWGSSRPPGLLPRKKRHSKKKKKRKKKQIRKSITKIKNILERRKKQIFHKNYINFSLRSKIILSLIHI